MKLFLKNKKAYFDYQILEEIEAGLVLDGQRVKSIRSGRINLKSSYISLRNTGKNNSPEAYLIGANIPPYQPKNSPPNYDPNEPIKLLLKKEEIKYLVGKTKEKGITLIPLKIYDKNDKIKLTIGIGKGKRKRDKRELIKKREAKREIKKAINGYL